MHLTVYQIPFTCMVDILCRHVEGGMGSVSLAIGKAAKEAGVHILTNAEVCLLEM